MPEQHPDPPKHLHNLFLPLLRMHPFNLMRLHAVEAEPLYFGRAGDCRFDDPEGQFGVLYGGLGLACCVAENLLGEASLKQGGSLHVGQRELNAWHVTRLELPAGSSLSLVDLTGPGLLRLGADVRLSSDVEYQVCQAWGRALWQHPEQPDGLYYRSRFDPACRCVALFDRSARYDLEIMSEGNLARHPELTRTLETYGVSHSIAVT